MYYRQYCITIHYMEQPVTLMLDNKHTTAKDKMKSKKVKNVATKRTNLLLVTRIRMQHVYCITIHLSLIHI